MLDKVVGVVEVEHAVVVGLGDLLRQQKAAGQVPAHLTGDVVSLGGGDGGILVGVLLRQVLVVVADECQDGLVGGVGLAHQGPGIAVDVFHQQTLAVLAGYGVGDGFNGGIVHAIGFLHRQVGLLNGHDNLAAVKVYGGAISLDYFHL